MEVTKQKLREALIEAFRTGQKAYQAPSYPMRIWAEEKIQELDSSNAESTHFQPCGKDFEFMEGDNIYQAMCGGEDGLCDSCAKQEASSQ